ncbi:MAG: four helix bundle protein [Chloroflexota bacterium]|nr:four helix bundle protein [Chloroflexota bacterium]
MRYEEWVEQVPAAITRDALWRTEVYRLALFVSELAWYDTCKLAKSVQMRSLSDQLYRAVGSVGANIAEGYSRASGKDQARLYEYALGSAREARHWYFQSRPVLGEVVAVHRMELLAQISRHLLRMIPKYRGAHVKEENPQYETQPLERLLQNVPMADETGQTPAISL